MAPPSNPPTQTSLVSGSKLSCVCAFIFDLIHIHPRCLEAHVRVSLHVEDHLIKIQLRGCHTGLGGGGERDESFLLSALLYTPAAAWETSACRNASPLSPPGSHDATTVVNVTPSP